MFGQILNKLRPRIEWARRECEALAVGKPRNATMPMHLAPNIKKN